MPVVIASVSGNTSTLPQDSLLDLLLRGIPSLYILGVSYFVIQAIIRYARLARYLRSEQTIAGYSFFNRIQVDKTNPDAALIYQHELVHKMQYHSVDLIYMELIRIINWFNPLVGNIQKELKLQHELFVDQRCAGSDKQAYARVLIAERMQVSPSMLLNEFSNKTILKTRIMMLFKDNDTRKSLWKYSLIIPVVALCMSSSLTVQALHKDVSPQQPDIVKTNPVQDELFTVTENPPIPFGGMSEFMKYIGQNYTITQEMIKQGIKGKVIVKFIVEKDGSLTNIAVVQDLGANTGQQAIDLLKKYPYKWTAGVQNNRKVRVAYTLPIAIDTELFKEKS